MMPVQLQPVVDHERLRADVQAKQGSLGAADLALQLGLREQELEGYLAGSRELSAVKLWALCDWLGTPLHRYPADLADCPADRIANVRRMQQLLGDATFRARVERRIP